MESSKEVLAHRRRGRGSGVLFVHGWLTGGKIWQRTLDELESMGGLDFEAIVPDLRGSGSSKGTASPELGDHVADLCALLDDLGGGDAVDVVGHSMGGAIAALMAARHPDRVRRVVLVCPVPPGGFQLPGEMFAQFDAVGGDADALRRFLTPQVPEADLGWMADLCAATDPESARNTLRAWTGASFVEEARNIGQRPLVVAGGRDPFLGPPVLRERVIDVIAGARLAEVDGGHYPMLDATAELATCLGRELEENG